MSQNQAWPAIELLGDLVLVVDVETYGNDPKNGKLLGVAMCPLPGYLEDAEYVALQWYDYNTSTWVKYDQYESRIAWLGNRLFDNNLIGHSYTGDKLWIDHVLKIDSKWHADTRLMWHMASAPSGPRPYGLKDAQVELLGWKDRGDNELEEQVKARGGKLSSGDHYLADLRTLSAYACLDASSTALVYLKLKPFFDRNDYWWMLDRMVQYSWLLEQNTQNGVSVDVRLMEEVIQRLTFTKEAFSQAFFELAAPYIAKLERMWKEDRASKYIQDNARQRFLSNWEMQKKFKLSSDKDKRELFYGIYKLPVLAETEGGQPSTATEAIVLASRDREDLKNTIEALQESESAETILNSFAKPWQKEIKNGRLHPRFNPCGTVSYRLSGFKPYLLNAPFDEKELMSCLTCDEGWAGVHADFVSVEPAVTAHYSQDPSLLKVFRDGLGDVYLDLALKLFPEDKELKAGYNPLVPITSAVKEAFKAQRKIAKVIQLAVQYTGTGYTVQENLQYAGIATSLPQARDLVVRYWQHFRKVAVMNEALFIRFERQGYLRNAVGRIIRVPTTIPVKKRDGTIWEKPIGRYKDLPNRFIQSSAHDLLSMWALGLNKMAMDRGVQAKPVLVDCHDSTSWQCPTNQVKALEGIFRDALTEVNNQVKLTVPLRAEMKRFTTLAGLKGDE
jgi:DNA polymerase I-like protein with 3'-5' exonuclease and polymerase domains